MRKYLYCSAKANDERFASINVDQAKNKNLIKKIVPGFRIIFACKEKMIYMYIIFVLSRRTKWSVCNIPFIKKFKYTFLT